MSETKYDAAYLRYSHESGRESTTLEVQKEQCEKMAGHPLVIYADEAKTGKTIAGRVGLQNLISDAHRIGAIYVMRYDRLGRNEADTFGTVALLEDAGCEVISCLEPRGELTRGIHMVIAAHYSRELAIKSKNSLIKRHEQQRWTGGRPPTGYKLDYSGDRNEITKIAIDPDEKETVEFIFRSFLDKNCPMGLKTIANELNKRAIPTRSMRYGHGGTNRTGDRRRIAVTWCKSTVRSILMNPIYTGKVLYNKCNTKRDRTGNGGKKVRLNDPSLHKSYQNESLRLISDEDFQTVQEKLLARKHPCGAVHNPKTVSPWTGLLFCAECGFAFYCRTARIGHNPEAPRRRYYNCGCRQRRGPSACSNAAALREDELMTDLQAVCSGAFDDMEGMVAATVEELTKSNSNNREEVARIRRETAELDSLASGLARQIANPALPALAITELGRQLEQVGRRREALVAASASLIDQSQDDIDAMAARIRERFEGAKVRLASIAMSGYELNALISEILGVSVVNADGTLDKLLPKIENPRTPVEGVRGVVTPTGFEPVSRP